ncbi:protein NRT1/ PTR FAMILY 5.6 [Cinnamomum micranthum f. kanehirae]|uniref:Protein NRT1/ PTR FAMILY 5.6 n=1 Tax=Cinnamomum micranthum f. kanehirae TaxID=337451 RepID=A0A3S3Q8W5_9MAGN|nr:protein NRT1/ PTR FAMILY 5.6 [Cinnamomum micranthum f. kanehirae]
MEREFQDKSSNAVDEEKWVYDSSLDYKGRVPLRASTGVWKASLFIIALELSERLSFFAINMNLVTYFTNILHQDVKTAAKNVNYWLGVTTMMPLMGGLIADAYLGRFLTVVVSSIFYLMALILLIMSQFVQSLKPYHTELHKAIFFTAIYMISIATGGHKPSLESFGADQFHDDHPEERKQKMSYFNLWSFSLCGGLLLGVTVVVYVQDNVSWGIAVVILTSAMAITTLVFLMGRPFYRYRAPEGSPFIPMLQVLVAALAKRNLPYPSDSSQLYEVPKSQKGNKRLLQHTRKLRFLDKAAIIETYEENNIPSTEKPINPWRLTTVTEVESMKLLINMVPIWLSSLMFGVCMAQTSTFFIKQGSVMNRKLAHNFKIPPASMSALNATAALITILIYDRILVPLLRRVTRNERGISILQRVGFGMVLSMLAMGTAAIVERKRLGTVEKEAVDATPMSVFWLAPQHMIFGVADAFTLVGLQEYFYDQVPDAMRSLGIAFYLSVLGASNFLSSLLIYAVDHVTQKGGRSGWFAKDLNKSRLDCFYWLLTVLSGINFSVYVLLATRYSYKKFEKRMGATADSCEGDDLELKI